MNAMTYRATTRPRIDGSARICSVPFVLEEYTTLAAPANAKATPHPTGPGATVAAASASPNAPAEITSVRTRPGTLPASVTPDTTAPAPIAA